MGVALILLLLGMIDEDEANVVDGKKLVVGVIISVVVVVVGIKLSVVVVVIANVSVVVVKAAAVEEALGLTGPSQTPALVHALTQSLSFEQQAPLLPSPLPRPRLPAEQVADVADVVG